MNWPSTFTKKNFKQFWLAVVSLNFIGTLYHKVIEKFFHLSYPYNTSLFRPSDRYGDFHNFFRQCSGLDPYLSHPPTATRPYFPFGYVFGIFLNFFGTTFGFFIQYSLFLVTLLSCFYWVSGLKLNRENIILFGCLLIGITCSYPFLYCFDRGNPEFLLATLMAIFYACLWKQKWHWGAIILAAGISMKLTPAVLLALFLNKKKYKYFFFTLFWSALFTITAYLILYFNNSAPFFSHLARMLQNQGLFNELYGKGTEGIFYSHSLYGAIKALLLHIDFNQHAFWFKKFFAPYSIFALLVGGFVFIRVGFFSKLSLIENALLLTSIWLLLPHMSADYKLLQILVLAPFYGWEHYLKKETQKWEWRILTCLVLLLSSMAYWYSPKMPEITSGVFVYPLLLSVIAMTLTRRQFKNV